MQYFLILIQNRELFSVQANTWAFGLEIIDRILRIDTYRKHQVCRYDCCAATVTHCTMNEYRAYFSSGVDEADGISELFECGIECVERRDAKIV